MVSQLCSLAGPQGRLSALAPLVQKQTSNSKEKQGMFRKLNPPANSHFLNLRGFLSLSSFHHFYPRVGQRLQQQQAAREGRGPPLST